jgi:GT2 family glycosyltransferase
LKPSGGLPLTVGITTRNRMDSLLRCVRSLTLLTGVIQEVIVVDDSSDAPVSEELPARFLPPFPLQVVRQDNQEGYIVARNRIAKLASSDAILFLDDDTRIVDAGAVWRASEVLARDPRLAAIAFAQGEEDGTVWPRSMQPAPVPCACYVPTFIGFAHLVRRDLFLRLGGYRSLFHFYGEEKEFCLRALDAGYAVVYLPDSRIAHVPDAAMRDAVKYLRYYTRNDCLTALYDYPWPLMIAQVARRLIRYGRIQRQMNVRDPGGLRWLLRELRRHFPEVLRSRRPVKWRTMLSWRRLKKSWPPYPAGHSEPEAKPAVPAPLAVASNLDGK